MSYLLAFTIAFLSFVGLGVEMLFYSQFFDTDPFQAGGQEVISMLPNPYFGLVDAVQAPLGEVSFTGDTPFVPFEYMLYLRQGFQNPQFGPAADQIGVAPLDMPRLPVWVWTVAIYIGITAFSLFRAAINVRAPSARIRIPKRFKGADA